MGANKAASRFTGEQLARFRDSLKQRGTELRAEIRALLLQSDEQHHRDLAGMVSDEGDESVANMLADLGAAIIDRHVSELREIEAAAARLEVGRYGVCGQCGGDIEDERLTALPAATRCIRCQTRHENIHVHEATPTL